jgi:hypothetical protein
MKEVEERQAIRRTVSAIELTTGVRPVGWHTRSAASPRQITSRPSKLVASYPLNFEVLKTGYESLRQKSANTRRGRIEPRDVASGLGGD